MSGAADGEVLALQLRGVRKQFGETVAVADVDLAVRQGTVHALLGENGAGKTTLMRVVAGLQVPEAGTIELFGRRVRAGSVPQAAAAGVGMVHQHLSLVPNLTTTENFALGRRGLYDRDAMNALLARTGADAGMAVTPDVPVADLSVVEQQRLEIVKAIAFGARLLILDEPTSLLAPSEVTDLLQWVRRFTDRGGTVVFVTHKLREALAIADDATVLRRGSVVHRGAIGAQTEASLALAIFGERESAATVVSERASRSGQLLVRAERVAVVGDRGGDRVVDVTFAVQRGDIVGVAAVEGSGHRELLAAVAGLRGVRAGTLALPGRIALVPADRARDGVIGEFTVTENVALRGAGIRRGLMPWKHLATEAQAAITRFGIVAPGPSALLRTLSGGNQQRVVLARELGEDIDLVVADNPTRGLDVRGTAFVHEQLRDAARRGAAIVVHSSDLDELLSLATRVLVVYHGAVREYPVDREIVGRAMLGAA